MDKKVRFGLVGCGRISCKHLEAMASLYQRAELVGVCDIIEERAGLKAREYVERLKIARVGQDISKPSVYIDLDEMLEKEELDVLSICTPSGLHPIHGIKAARRHVNVLSEKPMATELKHADELIRACEEAGVKLFVVKQNRFNPTMRLLKRAVDKGHFGRIYMILSDVLWARPQSYYDEAEWRGTRELDGGAFLNQASHYIDAVQWLGGPVESVTAILGTLGRKIEAEDTGAAALRFRNGAIGNINVTMLTYPVNMEGSIAILGEKGTAKVGGVAINRIEKWKFEDRDEDDDLTALSGYEPANVYGNGHIAYYENVLDALAGSRKPEIDGREARKSLELIQGIYKSAREGRTVQFPLDADGERTGCSNESGPS